MITTRNRISVFALIALVGCLSTLVVQDAVSQDTPVIEMKVEALDAGFRRLPDNQFVQGEEILIMVKIQNCTAMNARDQYDQDMARMARDGAVPPKANLSLDIKPVELGTESSPWTESVEFYWASPGQSADKMAGAVRTNLDFKPDMLARGAPKSTLELAQTEFWRIPTSAMDIGERSIVARFTVPDNSIPPEKAVLQQSVDFTIIDRAVAPSSELARFTMYDAMNALEEDRYGEAITVAREAIDYGPESKIDEAILQEIVGKAFEGLENLDSALAAYEETLRLAEQYFPGRSSFEARMEPKINKLRRQLGDKE